MDAEHYRLRDFLTRTAQPYEWHEAGSAEADVLLKRIGLVDATLPVVVDGDQTLAGASVEAVVEASGGYKPAKHKQYDFVVIGAGRQGLRPPSTPPRTASRRSSATATCRAAKPRTPP